MKQLLVFAASAAVLAACATAPAEQASPEAVADSVAQAAAVAPAVDPAAPPSQQAAAPATDEFLWLEEVESERALAWVRQQNERSLAVLKGDPRYEPFRQQALDILTATDRIPAPSFRAGGIDNFWQDKANPRGVWRRTTLDSYRTATPRWETVLDVDALGKAENRPWVFKGDSCLDPEERLCLVSLSNGGKDAVVVREFDAVTKQFVPNGFNLPEGKHRFDWFDRDTLVVATEFGPGTLTESGYPYIVKVLKRGQTLEQAREIFRGTREDGGYGVYPETMRDAEGRPQGILITRPTSTFEAENYWLPEPSSQPVRLHLPLRSTTQGWFNGRIVFTIQEDWGGQKAGSLLAMEPARLRSDADRVLSTAPAVVFAPGPRQSINEVAIARDYIVAAVYDEVRGRLYSFQNVGGRQPWAAKHIALPDNSSVSIVDTTKSSNQFFTRVEGFLTPATLMLADAARAQVAQVKASPPRFEAADATVEQFTATSRDGTRIPYFVVRPKQLRTGGSPTLLFGYGGFQVSKPPVYIPEMGKLWVENGGVFVNANIRGGGEFGPGWHQSVLREKRQGAFDDYIAVAEDLVRRGITNPDRLGIYGRSNGGVLTSVMMTQRPELIDAAVIESPLIDMLRYHELPAGASWIGEYGDPRVPEDYAFIARYSAYQNLKPGQKYPEPYITTNTRDDRVHPGHARKFAAKLQAMGYPALYYENTEGGHSNDADPLMNAERWARHYVYLARKLMD
ncbi:MAG TPA: prolyl oligopeptidase family serine peptidase [Caulobacteraceae bacterium]